MEFVGRLHPLLVHVPIGVLFLLVVAEAAGAWREKLKLSDGARLVVTSFAVAGSLAAVGCGWFLGENGSYDETLLDRHRILGFVTLGLTVVLLVVRRRKRIYEFSLGLAVVALTLTGHNGGSLTHGQDYLTAPLTAWLGGDSGEVGPKALAEVVVFDHVIQPSLNAKCVSCHGETKSEGELRLDSFAAIFEGGASGTAVVAGDPAESLLLQRLYLPMGDKKHMPPAGRPQPTDAEVALWEWWIASGATAEARLIEQAPDPEILEAVAAQLGLPLPPQPDREEMLAAGHKIESELGVGVRSLTAEGPWLAVNTRLAGEAFGDEQLKQLGPIAGAIHRLDLGGTNVTDQGLAALAEMTELRQLRLDRTTVSDAGLARLVGLARLESLNLHTTAITDEGLATLEKLPKLRRLYVWQTAVTREAMKALAVALENRRKLNRYQADLRVLEDRIAAETFQPDFGYEAPIVIVDEKPADGG